MDRLIFEDLKEFAEKEYPGFEIKVKEESSLMKAANVVLKLFNPDFMTGYVTTIGKTIYMPRKRFDDYPWETLAHELVHIDDSERAWGGSKFWGFLYLCPQILAVLVLLAPIGALLFGSCAWWLLLFVLCAAPFPAWWRAKAEMRGYSMSLAARYWFEGDVDKPYKDHVLSKFTGWDYFKMWPFKKAVQSWIDDVVSKLENGSSLMEMGPVHYRMCSILKSRGALNG